MRYQSGNDISSSSADSELEVFLIAAQKGDEQAFEMIWKHLNTRLLRYAAAQCYGSTLDYEEVVSESWISAARDISKFKGDFKQFRSWIYTVTRNRMVDGTRKRDRQVKYGGDVTELDLEDRTPRMEEIIEANEAVKTIVEQIRHLPEAQSEVVMLRVVADLSVEETAKIVRKSENSVRVLCHRGLATLREELTANGGDSNG